MNRTRHSRRRAKASQTALQFVLWNLWRRLRSEPEKTTVFFAFCLVHQLLCAGTVYRQPRGQTVSEDSLELNSIYVCVYEIVDLPTVVSTVSEYKNALANVQSYSCACTYGTMTAPVAGALPSRIWAFISSVNFRINWSWKRAISLAANLMRERNQKLRHENRKIESLAFHLTQISLVQRPTSHESRQFFEQFNCDLIEILDSTVFTWFFFFFGAVILPRPILAVENVQRNRYVPNIFDSSLSCFGCFGHGHFGKGDIIGGARGY